MPLSPEGTAAIFHVAKALIQTCHGRGHIALGVATSGIASLLLPKGATAHSTFKFPVAGLDKHSTCNISRQSGRAELMRQTKLIIWDEAMMCNRHCLEALDRTLRDLLRSEQPFGGVVIVVMGDLRQVLPVIPRANRGQIVRATFPKSPLWTHFTTLSLNINMRVVQATADAGPEAAADIQLYSDFLENVGDGTRPVYPQLGADLIRVPDRMLGPADLPQLIEYVVGDMPPPLHANADAGRQATSTKYFSDKAILAPKNIDVEAINTTVLDSLPGPAVERLSADSVAPGDDEAGNYTPEFLNSLDISGMPPHNLKLKVGAVIMLLRNLSPRDGMCNGTRLILTRIYTHLLEGIIITGDFIGTKVAIPRITLQPSESRFPFTLRRLQFPIKNAFAMTINKSQGQSLTRVGLYLPKPCFGHGQLYVALSRSGYPPSDETKTGVKVLVEDVEGIQGRFPNEPGVYTRNVVYKEVL